MNNIINKTYRYIYRPLCLILISMTAATAQSQSRELIILHTNDLHSRLAGYAPESQYTPLTTNDDKTIGGFARIARVLKNERAQRPDEVLILDAGDFLMGTFFHALEPVDGFQLGLMKKMGYDAICLGNHEFDFGIQTTADIISHSKKNNEIPPILLTNIEFNAEDHADDALQELYDTGILERFKIIEKNGIRIGLFGLLGYDASDVAPYISPAKITDPIKEARKMVRFLREEEKADIVICLSHSGVAKNKNGEWDGEDVELARKVKDIDVIISGHTHTKLTEPIYIGKTAIVQTGAYGANVGRLELSWDGNKVEFKNYRLIPVNDSIRGDFETHAAIENQKSRIQEKILNNLQINYSTPIIHTDFDLICDEGNRVENSNLGPFLADAIWYYINQIEGDNTDIAMIAAGVIRDNLAAGSSSIADIFRISSMGWGLDSLPGYPLAKVYVTGNELKKIIEVLLFAYHSSPGNYCYYSGLNVTYDPLKGFLRKVQAIEIGDSIKGYESVDFSKKNDLLYSISANAYMLEFVGMLKKMTYGLVRVVPKNRGGVPVQNIRDVIIDFNPIEDDLQEGKEWMATYHYILHFQDINQDGIPDIPDYYRNPASRIMAIVKE